MKVRIRKKKKKKRKNSPNDNNSPNVLAIWNFIPSEFGS